MPSPPPFILVTKFLLSLDTSAETYLEGQLEMPHLLLLVHSQLLFISWNGIKRIGPSAYLLSYYCHVHKTPNNMTKISLKYPSDILMEFWRVHFCGKKSLFSLAGNTWVIHYSEADHIYNWMCLLRFSYPRHTAELGLHLPRQSGDINEAHRTLLLSRGKLIVNQQTQSHGFVT